MSSLVITMDVKDAKKVRAVLMGNMIVKFPIPKEKPKAKKT